MDYYLWEAKSAPLLKLRSILQEQFSILGRATVIGGLIRDLAQVGSAGFKSDIDLVIDQDASRVERFARKVSAVKNKFGGYRYSTPSWNIDFWALETTWARVAGHVEVENVDDLLQCTFFTSDALLYHIDTKTLVSQDSYLADLLSGRLEINLAENPSPHGNLLRAVRRVLMRNMAVGPRLFSFVDSTLDARGYHYVVDNENRIYGSSIASLFRDHIELREEFARRVGRELVPTVQLDLPLDDGEQTKLS